MIKDTINREGFKIRTERLEMFPVRDTDARHYYRYFDYRLARFQYADAFEDVKAAKKYIKEYTTYREEGIHFVASIFDLEHNFVGSIQVRGIDTMTPVLDIWIASPQQRKGYAYESFVAMMGFLWEQMDIDYFLYEVDHRNRISIKLVEKLGGVLCDNLELVSDSGKYLNLDMFKIK